MLVLLLSLEFSIDGCITNCSEEKKKLVIANDESEPNISDDETPPVKSVSSKRFRTSDVEQKQRRKEQNRRAQEKRREAVRVNGTVVARPAFLLFTNHLYCLWVYY
jgi:hypothetical protein